jgi:hypothetical protein
MRSWEQQTKRKPKTKRKKFDLVFFGGVVVVGGSESWTDGVV